MNPVPASQPTQPWYRQAVGALSGNMPLKAFGTMGFLALFFLAYFYVLKNPAYPVTVMPLTVFDTLISFQPRAFPLYVSLWVYVSLPTAFLGNRRELYVHGLGMTATCLAGLFIFYFWPSSVPPADVNWALYPGMEFLKNLDAAGNACPSLHVATAIFSGVWLHHLLRRFGGPSWLLALSWVWCLGIAYSTLATRQHVAVDVGAGFVLGAAAAWLSVRRLEAGASPAPSFPAQPDTGAAEDQASDLLT